MSGMSDNQARHTNARSGTKVPIRRLHPAWQEFIRLCEEMGYGEIERIKVHDGLPVLAEVTRQKVRFIPP